MSVAAPLLHQICIVDGFDLPSSFPQIVRDNIDSFRAAHPEAAYTLWSGNALRGFLADHYERPVLAAFDTLRPYAYKCDLARLCLLHERGGLYADLGMRFLHPLRPPAAIGFAAFRSLNFLTQSWTTMSNGILWTQPGRRECRIAIDWIVENCRTRFYGHHPLCPSGPILLGQAAAAAMVERGPHRDPDQWIGQVVPHDTSPGELCCVSPDRLVVAVNVKRGRTLLDLGVPGTDAYADAWGKRTIYDEAAA